MSDLKNLIRSCLSPFIDGPEINALLDTMTDEALREQKLSMSIYDQLFVSTASGKYLDRKAAELGLIRPEDVGLEDLTFRNIVIDITASKQVTTILNSVLETFYGPEAVRTWAQSQVAEPYQLSAGMTLEWSMDGIDFVYEVQTDDYPAGHLAQATADEVAAAITKYIRSQGSQGFASVYIDPDTNSKYVRITTGVKGPMGIIKISGGEAERVFNFQNLIEYPAALPMTWTAWIVTKRGSTLRFSWYGNADPHLESIKEGDIAMIYGSSFYGVGLAATDLRGSFPITKVQPGVTYNILTPETAAYFEIENPNVVIGNTESIVINQGTYDSLRYYRPVIFRPYLRPRYALAWEADNKSLKIYLPAVTRVVSRQLIGASHLHLGKSTLEFLGTWGSNSVDAERLIVINDYSFSFPQDSGDLLAFGGEITGGIKIDYIRRENGRSVVVCKTPHGLTTIGSATYPAFSSANSYVTGDIVDYNGFLYQSIQNNPAVSQNPTNLSFWAKYTDDTKKSNDTVTITNVPEIADAGQFNGPYMYEPSAQYTIAKKSATLQQAIKPGDSYRILQVSSTDGIPDQAGYIMLDLNQDTEEAPIPYVGVLKNALILSPAYKFKNAHSIGDDVSYLSDNKMNLSTDGSDYPSYLTGVASARTYCQDIIDQVVALGIQLEIVIIYPDGTGYGYGLLPTDGSDYRSNDLIYIYGE
jgi:hypothetical protein